MTEGREDARPLIVTLQMDAARQDFFTDLRTRNFPPAINYLGAHLTLFHNLPGTEERAVIAALAATAAATAPFDMTASGVMKLGRGVAFRIESAALLSVRRRLGEAFAPWLKAQDRQKFRPHVTIQNKVSPAEAAGLHSHLARDFAPFTVGAEGLQLWHYDGGPWSPGGAFAFCGERVA